MRSWMKRVLGVVLTLALLVAMIPVTTANAATKKITMYVGESFTYDIYGGTITSVSSSKKAVVSVKKDAENKYRISFTAKKKGSAKLTVKYKDYRNKVYTDTINVTVKKLDFSVKMQKLEGGYVFLSVKNNTKQTFDQALVSYVLKDGDGEVVAEDSVIVSDLVPGKIAYDKFSYDNYSYDIDITKCTAKVVAVDRHPNYTYTDMNKNLKYEVTEERETDDYGYEKVILSLHYSNKYKENITGSIWVILYDENDQVVGLRNVSVYLKGKASDTQKLTIYEKNYDHYEVKTGVYYKKYN